MKLEEAIHQPKFKDEWHKAHVNVLFTAGWIRQTNSFVLKPFGISGPQFNILRILRGMHPKPASVKLLMERMLEKDSNASRLVDKLLEKGLVVRHSCPQDRRKVDVAITDVGLDLLEKASQAMEAQMHKSLHHLSEAEARLLSDLLDRMRG